MFFWRDPLSDADGSPNSAGTIFCPVHAVLGGMGEREKLPDAENTESRLTGKPGAPDQPDSQT